MAQRDFYEILGVSRTASDDDIKKAYRKLAKELHPDRNGADPTLEAKFKEVNGAYDILRDKDKRAAYDRFGHAAFEGGMGGGRPGAGPGGADFASAFSDVFDDLFGEFAGRGRGGGQRRTRGADLRYDLEITLDDAYHGKSTEIAVDVAVACDACAGSGAAPGTGVSTCSTCNGHGKVRAQQGFFAVERACPACHGAGRTIDTPCRSCRGEGRVDKRQTLTVEIPPGVDEGTRIRLSGRGEAGANGAPAGDLYIFLHVAAHPIFQREGTTLFARVPISFTTAALGDEIEVPGLDGKPHAIRIPAGIQSGKQLRQRGAGMPVLNGRGQGDMVVQIEVETPTKLSAKQKELLAAFRATETGDECPDSKGFFERMKKTFAG